MEQNTLLLIIIPLASIGGFLLIYCLVLFIMSLSGWHFLADELTMQPGNPDHPEKVIKFQRISFGWFSNYNGIVSIYFYPDGVMLKTFFFFKPFHPPLFINWHEMTEVKFDQNRKNALTIFVRGKKITFYRAAVTEYLYQQIKRYHPTCKDFENV